MKRMGHGHKRRAEEAKQRQIDRDRRTPMEQLAHLDSVLGVDVGAKKERARLAAQIQNGQTRSRADIEKHWDTDKEKK